MEGDEARQEEIEVLQAIYCGEGEFVAVPNDPFSFALVVCEGSATLTLDVTLSEGYPALAPIMRISSDVLSRKDIDELMKGAMIVLNGCEQGEPKICAVAEWLKEHGLQCVAAAEEQARLRAEAAEAVDIEDLRKDLIHGSRCTLWAERGDLFEVGPEWAMCHCVSKDFEMSAGIAAEFKRRFGGVQDLKSQNVDIGGVAVLEKKGRLIFYLVTKRGYKGKSTMESLELSLRAMKQHVISRGVKKLALPQIGCGLDQLSWGAVEGLVLQVFDDADVELLVRSR
eukprot:TRINITY_DN17982_c0_g1_i1.p1 TRINITY_DN17982_c0_g1~~TRINITY_DN17982_c0_g1_i1.p1  ORF type:complete len:283 (+),score=56.43 TRINITY_DN17982_c0_g1_i1:54-902(+)